MLLCPWNSPGKNTGMGSHSLFWGSSRPRDRTQVFCIAGRFFFTALQGDSLLFEPLGKSLWGVNILQLSFPFYAVQGHLQRLTKWNFKSWVLFAMYLTNTISYSPKITLWVKHGQAPFTHEKGILRTPVTCLRSDTEQHGKDFISFSGPVCHPD